MSMYYVVTSDELYHHGIKGQKWGVRRYQNEDGTLTEEGRRRYGSQERFETHMDQKNTAKKIFTIADVGLHATSAVISAAEIAALVSTGAVAAPAALGTIGLAVGINALLGTADVAIGRSIINGISEAMWTHSVNATEAAIEKQKGE